MSIFKFKKDKYVKPREGGSNFLDIGCSSCGEHILTYQKDGAGGLLRLYLDRIFEPENLSSLQDIAKKESDIPSLICDKCDKIIGYPMTYEKENRFAIRLIHGAFTKKRIKI